MRAGWVSAQKRLWKATGLSPAIAWGRAAQRVRRARMGTAQPGDRRTLVKVQDELSIEPAARCGLSASGADATCEGGLAACIAASRILSFAPDRSELFQGQGTARYRWQYPGSPRGECWG